jgi:hypothetical protein
VAALAGLIFFATRAARPRPEGGSVTGSVPGEAAPADAAEAQLREAVARHPDDVEARLDLARALLHGRDLMGVWNETQAVLARSPGHPRALAYQALVRLAMGQGEVAVSMLRQALSTDPGLLEARANLAFVYASLGRRREAEATVAETARLFPEEGARLKQALAQLEAEPASAPAPPAGEDPHAGVPPPTADATAPGTEAPRAAASLSGVIDASAAVRSRIGSAAVVFVTVREAGVDQGPPVAVKRLAASAFPLAFEIGPSDSMMGQPLPESVRLDVRADADGDPMTRPPSDPAARLDGVPAGTTGLRLELR